MPRHPLLVFRLDVARVYAFANAAYMFANACPALLPFCPFHACSSAPEAERVQRRR
jgi:hypothetical protein